MPYLHQKKNQYTIADFQLKLSYEMWEQVLDGNDVNKFFNSSLNIFLRVYCSMFPLIQAKSKMNQNSWITPGIITSCKLKRNYLRNYRIIIMLLLLLIIEITLKYHLWL